MVAATHTNSGESPSALAGCACVLVLTTRCASDNIIAEYGAAYVQQCSAVQCSAAQCSARCSSHVLGCAEPWDSLCVCVCACLPVAPYSCSPGYQFDAGLHYTVPWSGPLIGMACDNKTEAVVFDLMGSADGTFDNIVIGDDYKDPFWVGLKVTNCVVGLVVNGGCTCMRAMCTRRFTSSEMQHRH